MVKQPINLKDRLNSYKYEFDLLQKVECSKEECAKYKEMVENNQPLPEGVHRYTYENGEVSHELFYTVYKPDLSDAEINEYLTYKQLGYIKTIKNCVVFFTVLTVISLVLGFLAATNSF